jgi:hypothetical protein
MQESKPQEEAKPSPKPEPKEEVPRKEVLLKKKAKNHDKLPPSEQRELDAILAEEALAHEHGALIHKLSESADKYGRKQIGAIKKEITSRVGDLHAQERVEVDGVLKIYRKGMADADKELKATMQKIQEQHNKLLAEFKSERDKDENVVRSGYREKYDEAELEMDDECEKVHTLVASFIEDIQQLSIEQLRELNTAGIVQVTGGKNRDYLVVPGTKT